MRKIQLFGGDVAFVDDEDYALVSKYKWSKTKPDHRRTVYARTNIKDEVTGHYRTERMHRLILNLHLYDNQIVDHINGNGLDNRKSNLRLVSPSQNAVNVSIHKGNSSGYKGVSFRKERGTWRAEVRKGTKTVFKKTFKCKHYAARKYNEAVLKLHGEAAWLNQVTECDCCECNKDKRESG